MLPANVADAPFKFKEAESRRNLMGRECTRSEHGVNVLRLQTDG